MHIEKITRKGTEFAVIPVKDLQKLMEHAEMLADVKAYDAAKKRLGRGEDELIPFEIVERRVAGENAVKTWRAISRAHTGGASENLESLPSNDRRY